jgi:hypothetical protein
MTRPEQSKSWRDVIKVHPAADLFPTMTTDELRALGEDIKKNGVRVPVTLWLPDPNNNGERFLLDGRNRLDAMEMVGIRTVEKDGWTLTGPHGCYEPLIGPLDPFALIISANIHRRHLTADQKREVIAKVLKAQPAKSNRTIAKQTSADHKTVGAVRDKLEARGEIPHVSTVEDSKGRKQPTKRRAAAKADRAEVQANRYFAEPDTRAPADPGKYDDVAEHRATFGQFEVFLQVFDALEARGDADQVAEAILLLGVGDLLPRLVQVSMFATRVVNAMNRLKSPNAAAEGGAP